MSARRIVSESRSGSSTVSTLSGRMRSIRRRGKTARRTRVRGVRVSTRRRRVREGVRVSSFRVGVGVPRRVKTFVGRMSDLSVMTGSRRGGGRNRVRSSSQRMVVVSGSSRSEVVTSSSRISVGQRVGVVSWK